MEFKEYKIGDSLQLGPFVYEVKQKYICTTADNNSAIFRYLNILNKHEYVTQILGYKPESGDFPEVKTLKDLNKVIRQLQIDCLIKEAKEKYPVGTRYWPAHLNNSSGNFVVSDDQKIVFRGNSISLENPDGFLFDITRNGKSYNQVLWLDNKWAKIITEEPKQPEINTYGLKVGDEFSNRVLSEWTAHGRNRQQKKEMNGEWYNHKSNFVNNRTIESFKNIDGVVGFLVSGTCEVYLRAEGFKEFAEGFGKIEFEVGKWYKHEEYNHAIKYLRKELRRSRYAIVYSDYYNFRDKKHSSYPEGAVGVGYTDEKDWYELTDLSEIQEYLPDGHPDKIKTQSEYIVGKWYRLGSWIAKLKKLDKNKFYSFKSGTPFDDYRTSDGYLIIDYQNTPELITDMTEVYRLFPEEKLTDSDLQLYRWYEKDDFIIYLYARNSVYGFHKDNWFESTGFYEKGLKLCHPQKINNKFSKYIRNQYQIGDTVISPYNKHIFKIKELNFELRTDRIIISASGIKKMYDFLFYQGKWAEINSDCKILEKELDLTLKNPCAEIYHHINHPIPEYEIFTTEPGINFGTELLLKSKNKKQKFVKLTEIKTIKL